MALNVAQSPLHNFTFPQVPKSGFENFATCAFPLPPLTPPPLRPQVQETHHQRTFQHVRATAQHSSSSSSSRFHTPRQGQAFVHASSCGVIAKAETARRFITLSDRTQSAAQKPPVHPYHHVAVFPFCLTAFLRQIGRLAEGCVLLSYSDSIWGKSVSIEQSQIRFSVGLLAAFPYKFNLHFSLVPNSISLHWLRFRYRIS